MSDDLKDRLRHGVATYDDMADAAELMEAQETEIARLRDLCDRQSTALSLSGMRHGRILVGLERRNARQRRALAKLYQRRHDKNAALATLEERERAIELRFWQTVDRDGLTGLPSDMWAALEQLVRDRAALAPARREGMEEAAKIAESEPEFPGPMPAEFEKHSRETLARAACIATKRGIVAAICAAAGEGKP
ncbi:MAG: hypothetical protein ACK5PR_03020 [bacterium]